MKKYLIIMTIFASFFAGSIFAQTAIDFTLNDCNGTSRNLYTTLNQGKVAVVVYEMQCTGSLNGCTNITTVMNNFYSTTNKIEMMYLDNVGHNCTETSDWVTANNLFPGTNFEYSTDYTSPYGSGMPVIVITGGVDHDTYLVSLGASDTATIHNAIKQALTDLTTTPKAFDFTLNNCDGDSQNLYSYLDQNKVAVLIYEMQCMGSNMGATKVSTVMNNFYSNDTNVAVMYLDNVGNDCASTAAWISSHSYFPGINFEYSNDGTSPYGSGMPVIVVTGGSEHKVCLIVHGASTTDTNAIHLAIQCAVDELTTSIAKTTDNSNTVNIYPNPVTSDKLILDIDFHGASVERADIIDLTGNIVRESVMINTNNDSKQKEISVSGLTNGIYLIRVYTNKSFIVKKFTVTR